nr:ABC transporter ATP-binding protein [Paramuribaculum sp.]
LVDHLWVMEGDGDIRDFPGTYTEYREWREARDAQLKAAEKPADKAPTPKSKPVAERRRKMSFKERKEFETLTEEIDTLTAERNALDARFSSGETLDDAAAMAARYSELTEMLDEKEMRWLELSELE